MDNPDDVTAFSSIPRRKRPEAVSRKLAEIKIVETVKMMEESDDIMEFVDAFLQAEGLLDENKKLKKEISIDLCLDDIASTSNTQNKPCTSSVKNDDINQDESLLSNTGTKRKYTEDTVTNKTTSQSQDCPICLESFKGRDLGTTLCGHVFCWSCLSNVATELKKCPTCRKKITKSKIVRIYFKM